MRTLRIDKLLVLGSIVLLTGFLVVFLPTPTRAAGNPTPTPIPSPAANDVPLNPQTTVEDAISGTLVETLYVWTREYYLHLIYTQSAILQIRSARPILYQPLEGPAITGIGAIDSSLRSIQSQLRGDYNQPSLGDILFQTPHNLTYNLPFVGYWQGIVRTLAAGYILIIMIYAFGRYAIAIAAGQPYEFGSVFVRAIGIFFFMYAFSFLAVFIIEFNNDLSLAWSGWTNPEVLRLPGSLNKTYDGVDLLYLYDDKAWETRIAQRGTTDLSEPRYYPEEVAAFSFYTGCLYVVATVMFIRILIIDALLILAPLAALLTIVPETRRYGHLWATSFLGVVLCQVIISAFLEIASWLILGSDLGQVPNPVAQMTLAGGCLLFALSTPVILQRVMVTNVRAAALSVTHAILGALRPVPVVGQAATVVDKGMRVAEQQSKRARNAMNYKGRKTALPRIPRPQLALNQGPIAWGKSKGGSPFSGGGSKISWENQIQPKTSWDKTPVSRVGCFSTGDSPVHGLVAFNNACQAMGGKGPFRDRDRERNYGNVEINYFEFPEPVSPSAILAQMRTDLKAETESANWWPYKPSEGEIRSVSDTTKGYDCEIYIVTKKITDPT